MKTILKAKEVIRIYKVNSGKTTEERNGIVRDYYTTKPTIEYDTKNEWNTEILSYDGEPAFNYYTNGGMFKFGFTKTEDINISETETVRVENAIFRADLNEYHLHTNKVVKEIELNKIEAEEELKREIATFNRTMIESNDKMKRYCLEKDLNPEEHSPEEIFKFVYPNKGMKIVDGEIIAVSHLFNDNTIDVCANGVSNRNYRSYRSMLAPIDEATDQATSNTITVSAASF